MFSAHLSHLFAQQRSVYCLINEYDDDDDDDDDNLKCDQRLSLLHYI